MKTPTQKRRFKRMFVLKLIALIPVLIGLFVVFEHVRGKRAYKALLDEMRANGEETDARRIAPVIPNPSGNIAMQLADLDASLTAHSDEPGGESPTPSYASPGQMRPSWKIDSWIQTRFVEDGPDGVDEETLNISWQDLRDNLDSNPISIERLEEVLSLPRFHTGWDYRDFSTMKLEGLSTSKSVANVFAQQARVALRDDDANVAASSLQSILRLSVSMEEEPLLITQLVRFAIARIAFNLNWEVLVTKRCDVQSLRSLIQAWKRNDFATPVCSAMVAERAANISYLAKLREDRIARNRVAGSD